MACYNRGVELDAFHDLLMPGGQEVLRAAEALAPRERDFLRHYSALSRRFPPPLVRAALETAILRGEAAGRFPQAAQMYFTREALEQATPAAVAEYRAGRFAGFERVADLGCSLGSDTLALARVAPVVGVDRDPLRLALAAANLRALGLGERASFIQADLRAGLPLALSPGLGLFFDPARRAQGRRAFSVREYQPPLEILHTWLAACPALGAKISPGVDLDELAGYPAEVEFISLDGELKEAALWFGPLRSAVRRATLLSGSRRKAVLAGQAGVAETHTLTDQPAGVQVHTLTADANRPAPDAAALDAPRGWLYEPDPAVLRAGLVQQLAVEMGAAQLDPEIAYLTTDEPVATPFARGWPVEAWFPFQLKRLRQALRARGVRQALVKKRGSPLDPQELLQQLGVKEGTGSAADSRVIFLTQMNGRPVVILCYPGP